jgi:hypothetical protein
MYVHESEAVTRRMRQARRDAGASARRGPGRPSAAGATGPTGARSAPLLPRPRTAGAGGAGRSVAATAAAGTGPARTARDDGVRAPRRGTGGRAEAERAALAVAPPAPVAVPRTAFVVLVLTVVAVGVIGILLLNTKVNENAFILHDLQQEQARLDRRQQELEQQIAQASSPVQLDAAARRLGLVKAEHVGYLRLSDGEIILESPDGVTGDDPLWTDGGVPDQGVAGQGGPDQDVPDGAADQDGQDGATDPDAQDPDATTGPADSTTGPAGTEG